MIFFGIQKHKLRPNLYLLEAEQGTLAEDSVKYKQ